MTLTNGTKDDFKYTGVDNLEIMLEAKRYNIFLADLVVAHHSGTGAVLDFGAGKGYLTFAVHEHLRASGRLPDVTGVELRGELATLCNQAVARLGLQGLRFDAGDVRSHPASATDIRLKTKVGGSARSAAMSSPSTPIR